MNYRTDMAVESVPDDYKYEVNRVINGMNLKKCYIDKKLKAITGKNEGIYYNLDNIDYFNKKNEIKKIISSIIKDYLETLEECSSILIVGLGNLNITPDCLGPLAISKIEVNRHLEVPDKYMVSAISPGVMGQTGMETSDVVKALVKSFKPDLVLVIDALACNSLDRMCHSIQLSSAGINPGSGVNNHRRELSKKTLGVDVFAIGVPTVCDLSNIYDIEGSYFITPNNIDEAMDILGDILAGAINHAFLS